MTLSEAKLAGVRKVKLPRWLDGTYLTVPAVGDAEWEEFTFVIPATAGMEIRNVNMADDQRNDWIPAV